MLNLCFPFPLDDIGRCFKHFGNKMGTRGDLCRRPCATVDRVRILTAVDVTSSCIAAGTRQLLRQLNVVFESRGSFDAKLAAWAAAATGLRPGAQRSLQAHL